MRPESHVHTHALFLTFARGIAMLQLRVGPSNSTPPAAPFRLGAAGFSFQASDAFVSVLQNGRREN